MLLIKIIIVESVIYILFFQIFGLARVKTNAMMPNINGGDLAFFYHLDNKYEIDDVVTYFNGDSRLYSRVIAKGGDTIEIKDDLIYVNSYPIDSIKIFSGELTGQDRVQYPYTVPSDEVFVINDNRDEKIDSRNLGSIKIKDLDGKVISIIRTRGL